LIRWSRGFASFCGMTERVYDNQIHITVDDVELVHIDSSLRVEDTASKVLLTDLEYKIKAAFPLAALQIDPVEYNLTGFEVQVNNNDDGSGRET